jgi:NADH:ubiquinone oxidoreductase subunit
MATIGTLLYTWFNGTKIGEDEFGNIYYQSRNRKDAAGRLKRWVVYKGMAEPSKVPAAWHGWLHYTQEKPPTERVIAQYDWQKPHLPNRTGTPYRHLPPGHILKGGQRAESKSGDYEAWTP